MNTIHYEVHWARANSADQLSGLRTGPVTRHSTRAAAEAEARSLRSGPAPSGHAINPYYGHVVPIVVEVRRG